MNRVRIYDGSFPQEMSATLSGDNSGLPPEQFRWCRNRCDSLNTWYTDMHLMKAATDFHSDRIAWLIEPPAISDSHYRLAYKLRKQFRYIFTFVRFYAEMGQPFKYYPFGGSWIADENWGLWGKGRKVSIIVSEKDTSIGHKLRHNIVGRFRNDVRVFGSGYKPIKSKIEALADFRYSIVVESWRGDWYFSEKLIDCLSVGTIPIYWGCPSIRNFFDDAGIIPFEDIDDLYQILDLIGEKDYKRRTGAVKRNLEKAKKYRCAEDWLFEKQPELFK